MRREDVKLEAVHDKPKSGMWHTGPNPCWITVTHIPTMCQVRLYSGDRIQNKVRDEALELLELAVSFGRVENCSFPENVAPTQKGTDE